MDIYESITKKKLFRSKKLKYVVDKKEAVDRFYLLKNIADEETASKLVDVTNDIDTIYKTLGEPFIRASEELDRIHASI